MKYKCNPHRVSLNCTHLLQFVEEDDGKVGAVLVDVVPVGGVGEEDVLSRESGRPLQVGVDLLAHDEVALRVLGGHGDGGGGRLDGGGRANEGFCLELILFLQKCVCDLMCKMDVLVGQNTWKPAI